MPAMDGRASKQIDDTLDASEVDRFAAMAQEWWDPKGKFAPLHAMNPSRLAYLRDQLCTQFNRDPRCTRSLTGLRVVDVGCGGGLLCEPLARLGAVVTGLDPAAETIDAARVHAESQGLEIDYRAQRAEALVDDGLEFDAVLALEVVEHVPDVSAFVKVVGSLVRPGGLLLLSTINRTIKSYALAIVGAEYLLRWLPVGTHQWDRFVTPTELSAAVSAAGMVESDRRGIVFNPLLGEWRLGDDVDVNYLMTARHEGRGQRPGQPASR